MRSESNFCADLVIDFIYGKKFVQGKTELTGSQEHP